MSRRDVLLATAAPLLWGVAFVAAKPALAQFPPALMTALVYALTAALLSARAREPGRTPVVAAGLIAFLVATAAATLIFAGLSGLPASLGVLVVQTQVPFAALAAWLVNGERVRPRTVAGTALAFAGVALIAGWPGGRPAFVPLLLVIAGAAVWGLGQALIRRLARDDGTTLLRQVALHAAPQLLLVSLLTERGQLDAIRTAGPAAWAALVFLAVAGYVLAYSIWYDLLRRHQVDVVIPFVLLMPLAGVLASALLLGERIAPSGLLGGVLIVGGLAVVVDARPRLRRAPAAEG